MCKYISEPERMPHKCISFCILVLLFTGIPTNPISIHFYSLDTKYLYTLSIISLSKSDIAKYYLD